MSQYQSDEKVSDSLNKVLPEMLDERDNKCISNSVVIDNNHGHYIMYMARGKRQQLLIVLINLTTTNKASPIRLLPIKVKHQQSLQGMLFNIAPSPYMKTIYSFVAYDPKKQSSNSKQTILFFAPFTIDQNGGEKLNQVELHMVQTRQHGKVKDVKWYPFAALTIAVLTDSKILTFNLQMDHINPINQIYLKDLTISVTNQTVKNNQFQLIAFSNILNHKQEYPSLGKKITAYLISKTGEIYLLFPFICPDILINGSELNQFYDLKERLLSGNRLQYEKRNVTILEWVAKATKREVEGNQYEESVGSQNQEQMYGIQFHHNLSLFKVQLFKLNSSAHNSKYNNTMRSPCKSVSSFKVLQLSHHTLFLHDQKPPQNKKDYQLTVQIFSQQPYARLLSANKHGSNFVIQTVGELKFSKSQSLRQRQSDSIKLITQSSMTNDMFLLHNNLTCYRLSFDGLSNLLSSPHADSLADKLIDCDVLFKSASQLVTITNNQSTIYFMRYQNNNYFFQSVPLQSIQLSQTIRNTIEQTQNLFRKLGNKPLPNTQKDKKQHESLQFAKINESTLVEIQDQLAKFNKDSKKYIESKLYKVKTLYQAIISKQSLLQLQQRQKQQLINLINQAEENDNKIKSITSKNTKNLNRTEKDLDRRIRSMHKSLDEMKKTFQKENQSIQKDEEKRQTMEQCIQQADVVISKLEEMKRKLTDKRNELRKAQVLA